MQISKAQLANFIKHINSSMKYQDLSETNADELINKYENLLYEREKQIKEYSNQMGILNEKLFDSMDKLKKLSEENTNLEEKSKKSKMKLKREIESRMIMAQKIENLIKENSSLRQEIKNIIGDNSEFDHKRGGSVARRTKTSSTYYDNIYQKLNDKDTITTINNYGSPVVTRTPIQSLLSENINYIPVFKSNI
ncbi:MAG: hypothetical protein MJ252_25780 [archaeon]|nr:hypothetical protein [archaeon]